MTKPAIVIGLFLTTPMLIWAIMERLCDGFLGDLAKDKLFAGSGEIAQILFLRRLLPIRPFRCWNCRRSLFLSKVRYRRDDVVHAWVANAANSTSSVYPRPYCSNCFEKLGLIEPPY